MCVKANLIWLIKISLFWSANDCAVFGNRSGSVFVDDAACHRSFVHPWSRLSATSVAACNAAAVTRIASCRLQSKSCISLCRSCIFLSPCVSCVTCVLELSDVISRAATHRRTILATMCASIASPAFFCAFFRRCNSTCAIAKLDRPIESSFGQLGVWQRVVRRELLTYVTLVRDVDSNAFVCDAFFGDNASCSVCPSFVRYVRCFPFANYVRRLPCALAFVRRLRVRSLLRRICSVGIQVRFLSTVFIFSILTITVCCCSTGHRYLVAVAWFVRWFLASCAQA